MIFGAVIPEFIGLERVQQASIELLTRNLIIYWTGLHQILRICTPTGSMLHLAFVHFAIAQETLPCQPILWQNMRNWPTPPSIGMNKGGVGLNFLLACLVCRGLIENLMLVCHSQLLHLVNIKRISIRTSRDAFCFTNSPSSHLNE